MVRLSREIPANPFHTVKTAMLITNLLTILNKDISRQLLTACIHNVPEREKRRYFCVGAESRYLLPVTAADLQFYELIFYITN